jgi:hypothetical protein
MNLINIIYSILFSFRFLCIFILLLYPDFHRIKHRYSSPLLLTDGQQQMLYLKVIAGTGTNGYNGDGQPATSAQLNGCGGVFSFTTGILYVADRLNRRIRKIDLQGIISTVAGTGADSTAGSNGAGTSTAFHDARYMTADTMGNFLYFSDDVYVWKFQLSNGILTRFGGVAGTLNNYGGDGGQATSAVMNRPLGIWLSTMGYLYIADFANNRVRVIAPDGIITTFAGSGPNNAPEAGSTGGDGGLPTSTSCKINGPHAVYADTIGDVFIAGYTEARIRKVNSANIITTFAGGGAGGDGGPASSALLVTSSIRDVKGDSLGNIYFISNTYTIKMVNKLGILYTIAGTGTAGTVLTFSPATSTNVQLVCRLFIDTMSNVYFSEDMGVIRRTVNLSPSSQPSGQPSRQPSSQPSKPPSSQPSVHPSSQPTKHPTNVPSNQPSVHPSQQPSSQPSNHPTKQPFAIPTNQPLSTPSSQPSELPTCQPSFRPTSQPALYPSAQPSALPSCLPSKQPLVIPTNQPSSTPSSLPSKLPSCQPSCHPTSQPSLDPSAQPSAHPSSQPTKQPTNFPSNQPSIHPSQQPSSQPSNYPSKQPFAIPTNQPSSTPSSLPAGFPTCHPSLLLTSQPTGKPSELPLSEPSTFPSRLPCSKPSNQPSSPTVQPFGQPSSQPSSFPSFSPSTVPTVLPSTFRTSFPSSQPLPLPSSSFPSGVPTSDPVSFPSSLPSSLPTCCPTSLPTIFPFSFPTWVPSSLPSDLLTCFPSVDPTSLPSMIPLSFPSSIPSRLPSIASFSTRTRCPSTMPTIGLSIQPISYPSWKPMFHPSVGPSMRPTSQLSSSPFVIPSGLPTVLPSFRMSVSTSFPASYPSSSPIASPSHSGNQFPFASPTLVPVSVPSLTPILVPDTSLIPSQLSSSSPVSARARAVSPFLSSFSGELSIFGTTIVLPSSESSSSLSSNVIPVDSSSLCPEQKSFIVFGQKGNFIHEISLDSSSYNGVELSRSQGGLSRDSFTRSVVMIGDINHDGYPDMMIGYPVSSVIDVYFGNNNDEMKALENVPLSFVITGEAKSDWFGWSIAKTGDINGDQIDDIVILARNTGLVYVIYGKKDWNERKLGLSVSTFLSSSSSFVSSNGYRLTRNTLFPIETYLLVSSAGDFNKDGFNDIIISTIRGSGQGIIYLVYGRNSSIYYSHDLSVDSLIGNIGFSILSQSYSFAGISLAGLGDVNGDGYDDIGIGSMPTFQGKYLTQRTYVVYGRNGSFSATDFSSFSLSSMTFSDGFTIVGGGFMIGGVGDVNNDGINDIMVVNYDHWQGKKGNAYLLLFPKYVSAAPSSRPSRFPTSFPSSQPTVVPSFFEETSYPTNRPTFSLSPTLTLTYRPTVVDNRDTLIPSIVPTVCPSRRPIQLSSHRPSQMPFFSLSPSLLPTLIPTFSRSMHPSFNRKAKTLSPSTILPSCNPTVLPTMLSSVVPSSVLRIIDITVTRKVSSPGRHYTNNSVTVEKFVILSEERVDIICNEENDDNRSKRKKIYTLFPFADNVVVLHCFNISSDIIDLREMKHIASSISSVDDLSFSSDPFTLVFPYNQRIIILPSFSSYSALDGMMNLHEMKILLPTSSFFSSLSVVSSSAINSVLGIGGFVVVLVIFCLAVVIIAIYLMVFVAKAEAEQEKKEIQWLSTDYDEDEDKDHKVKDKKHELKDNNNDRVNSGSYSSSPSTVQYEETEDISNQTASKQQQSEQRSEEAEILARSPSDHGSKHHEVDLEAAKHLSAESAVCLSSSIIPSSTFSSVSASSSEEDNAYDSPEENSFHSFRSNDNAFSHHLLLPSASAIADAVSDDDDIDDFALSEMFPLNRTSSEEEEVHSYDKFV